MATVLQPIVNELNTVLVQLRTELRGLQTDADGAGIAIQVPIDKPLTPLAIWVDLERHRKTCLMSWFLDANNDSQSLKCLHIQLTTTRSHNQNALIIKKRS